MTKKNSHCNIILGECELREETTAWPAATRRYLHIQRLRFYGRYEVGFAAAVGHEQAEQLVHGSHEHALGHGFGEQMGSGHQNCAIRGYSDDLLKTVRSAQTSLLLFIGYV